MKPKAETLKTKGTCAICGGLAWAGLRGNRKIVPICGSCVAEYLKDEAREAFEALQIERAARVSDQLQRALG